MDVATKKYCVVFKKRARLPLDLHALLLSDHDKPANLTPRNVLGCQDLGVSGAPRAPPVQLEVDMMSASAQLPRPLVK